MTDLDEYPGIDLAYEHVSTSYEAPHSRMDVIEGRVGSLISLVATVTVAVPTVVRGLGVDLDFTDWRFMGAILVGALTVCGGLWLRNRGTLKVLDPRVLYQQYLDLEPKEFKHRVFYWAAEHFDANTRSVDHKAKALDRLTLVFLAEIILFVWWLSG